MAIKKGEKITASDISSLKTRVQNIYSGRTHLSDAGLNGLPNTNTSTTGFGTTDITTGNEINRNFYYAINALLQLHDINSEIVKNNQYDFIITNHAPSGDKDLLELIADWHTSDPKKTQPSESCRGGCVGFCYGCTQSCSYACKSTSAADKGDTGGVYEGHNACNQQCTGSCWKSCNGYCYGLCNKGCTGCTGTCSGSGCTGGCHTRTDGSTLLE